MTLHWKQGGDRRKQEFPDWDAAATEGRQLIIYAGATSVVIHEEA